MKKYLNILEKHFSVYNQDDYDYMELSSHTDGGVEMITTLYKNDILKNFLEYVDNFNIDEEIDTHRQAKDFCNAFTIRQSVEDFEEYEKFIQDIAKQLKGV